MSTMDNIIGDVLDRVQKTNIKMDVKYKYDHVENGVKLDPHHVSTKSIENFKLKLKCIHSPALIMK